VGGPQHGDTPLHAAAQRGHTAIVELLKAAEAKVLRGGPLHVAAEDGDKATVEELLAAAGVDVNVQKKVCIFLAPPSAHPLTVSVTGVCAGEARWWRRPSGGTRLTRHPLTGCVWGVQDGSTPLHMAAKNGHTAIVEALVTAGAEVNVTDKVCTSLHPAPTSRVVSPRVVVCCDGASHHDGGPRVSLTAR
jgi:hypothetical protein